MKAWLPALVAELKEGRAPILALARAGNLARAALFDDQGELLAGSLGSPAIQASARERASSLAPGQVLIVADQHLTLERLAAEDKNLIFWSQALEQHDGAWAAWLLVMPKAGDGLKLNYHMLSAFGPWTTPRLPEEMKDSWSFLPLNPGVGRLFIFGDDALALESAGLAGRAGLSVTWFAAETPLEDELAEAKALGDFSLKIISTWADLTVERLTESGLRAGTMALVTVDRQDLIERIKELSPRYLGLAGEVGGSAGLFPKAATTSLAALGLVAEMVSGGVGSK